MSLEIKLKNRENTNVIIDQKSFDDIQSNSYLTSLKFLDNLRAHSNGYAIYQRCITTKQGPVYETIYLHKYLAEKFCKKPKGINEKLFVRFINGNVIDVRTENLEWVTMSTLRRQMKKSKSSSGYRGVIAGNGRFRAVIYNKSTAISLGFFETAEAAAAAYNKKSIELFGETSSLNKLPDEKIK